MNAHRLPRGLLLGLSGLLLAAVVPVRAVPTSPAIRLREFVYEQAPFPSCHASTVAKLADGTVVAAWFGGTRERHPDVGIWVSRRDGAGWDGPREVATGVQPDGKRHPTWNPVLFQPRGGPLLLFYKVGPSPSAWWGMVRSSPDGGRSWGEARRLPEGILGPVKNKPVELADGTLLSGSSTESDDAADLWRVHFERSRDGGLTWEATGPVNDGSKLAAIQPSLLLLGAGRLQAVGRTRQGRVFTVRSEDGGRNWGPMALLDLPNPNAGTDAHTMADGRHVLVYNHTPKGRSPLNVAVSTDGVNWRPVVVLEDEPGEYSYPAVIQGRDGSLHVTYTWKRQRIRHVVLDPAKF